MRQYSPSSIFLGNTPQAHRKWLSVFLAQAKSHYKKLVIPCCGGFAIAEVAVKAGWKPSKIVASDVALFTTVLARAINEQPIDDLEIQFLETSPIAALCNPQNPVDVLYAIKLGTQLHQGKSVYDERYLNDLIRRKEDHIEQLAQGIEDMAILSGIHYEVRDMFDHIRASIGDSKNVLWVNPPGYLKGYTKLYNWGDHISWTVPESTEFDPGKDHALLRELFMDAQALGVRYRYKELAKAETREAVFAVYKGTDRYDYLLSNRPDEVKSMMGTLAVYPVAIATGRSNAVIPSDYDITVDSSVEFRGVAPSIASYYRDLFIHNLGTTKATWNFIMMIDGYIAGTVGFSPSFPPLYQNRHRPEELFGLCPSYDRYNLNKLLMMLITSGEFKKELASVGVDAHGIKTTCLSKYPEMKINRGILKMTGKEYKNGMYVLRYEADMRNDTYSEVIGKWIKRESERLKVRQKIQEKS